MKNVQEINTHLKLSKFETKVLRMICTHGSITSIEIAKRLYRNVDNKPKCLSNGITSAVRQINRKLKKNKSIYKIHGIAGGRGGKTLYVDLDYK